MLSFIFMVLIPAGIVAVIHSIPEESEELVRARKFYGKVPEEVCEKVQVGPFKIKV